VKVGDAGGGAAAVKRAADAVGLTAGVRTDLTAIRLDVLSGLTLAQ
jgi:hypothetical protein